MNPFKYGDPVEGEYYLDRPDLKKAVLNFINSHINVVLIGPRRFGKTSFINDLQKQLRKDGYACVFVDTFNVTSHRDFLRGLLEASFKEKTTMQRLREWITTLPKKYRPVVQLEPAPGGTSGSLNLTVQPHELSDDEVKDMVSRALEALATLGKKVSIAFDEFQTIGALDDKEWLEATIRTKMQQIKNVSFLFSGSRHGMIHDMFNSASRPFYRSCQLIDFPPLGPEFTGWVQEKFSGLKIPCDAAAIDYLRKQVSDTPNYVQMACFQLVANEISEVSKSTVDQALKAITGQNSYAYQTLLNSLTPVQQRVLRLAACEGKEIYSKEVLKRYEIKSAAHVSQAINSLVSKQILDEATGGGVVIFDDPLFAIWLRREFSQSRPN